MPAKILVVDDERPIIDVLSYNLTQANYEVIVAFDGAQALIQARDEQPDLIILDLMLPELDGLEVFRIIRHEQQDVPIIMLTARDDEVDRVVGLELGADDYIIKPFSVRELLARVKNVLRRATQRPVTLPSDRVRLETLTMDATRYEAYLGEAALQLTTQEFELLFLLARHAGQVFSRAQLLERVWGYDYHGDLRVVDAAIKRLRTKLRQADSQTELIVTVRGVGYKLSESG